MSSKKLVYISAFLVLFAFGCNHDEEEEASAETSEVVADFTVATTEVEAGDSVYFTNTSQYASYYQWDFGDGGLSFEESPAYVYSGSGSFEVQLIAIGTDGGADTASVTINVTNPNYSIYEGIGIEGVSLYTSWGDVSSTLGTDTIYQRSYLSDYDYYYHLVYYYDEGLAFVFYNTATKLGTSDVAYVIIVVAPYTGVTASGIGIGSDMDLVVDAYGSPEDTYEGSGYWGYWYDSIGVDFYSYDTDEVDEIDIYQGSDASSRTQPRPDMELIREKWRHLLGK